MRRDGRPVPRLFVESPLAEGAFAELADGQRHYLARVMRLGQGDGVRLFNGRDGEWLARLDGTGVLCEELLKVQTSTAGPWLLFAPPKKDRLRFLVEKATELGAGRLMPITTARTEPPGTRTAKFRDWAVEAAEQSGRLDVPACFDQQPLAAVLEAWPVDRALLLCDETGGGKPASRAFSGDAGILIGPEGGFDPGELRHLKTLAMVVPVSLGAHILRIETAAVAALAAWQARRDLL